MTAHTKIICTIGPSVNTLDKITRLIEAGMNVARLNFSHGTHSEHLVMINYIKEARQQLNMPVAIMLDTKGPEIRIGKILNNELILLPGQKWLMVKEEVMGDAEKVTVTPGHILDQLKDGERVLFDDGYIASKVIDVSPAGVLVEITNGGMIKSNKGVNIPMAILNLPVMTEKDVADIQFGCLHDIDIIAASFVRSAEHVLEIKKLLKAEKKPETLVIAKIENREGVQNFDSIVQAADGIMIARGDLGVEVPLSQIPILQKMMIRKCYLAGKPAITATQMLESMIYNPRPTRAEVSDVANAIYDSTSAVMLSGETAVGKYPLETVHIMKAVIREAEADFQHAAFFNQHSSLVFHDVPSAVTLATVKTAYTSNAQAIFAFTSQGSTARLLSRLRPSMPIIAMTPNEKCFHQLAINWGVIPMKGKICNTILEAFNEITKFSLEKQLVTYGDLVIVTAGTPFGISGTTNMMIVENIGDVLLRGYVGSGKRVYGNITMVLTPESDRAFAVKGKLLVITKCDESYLPLIREAEGVILQNLIDDTVSEKYLLELAKQLDKTVLVRADGACRILKEGQLVTIDPEKALVYNRILPQ